MKLLFCTKCMDIVQLRDRFRTCACGASWGNYTDEQNAIIGGEAVPIGFSSKSFMLAFRQRPQSGNGSEFLAFVIPHECRSITVADAQPAGGDHA